MGGRIANRLPSCSHAALLKLPVLGLALICLLAGTSQPGLAQNNCGVIDPAQMPDFAIDAIKDAHRVHFCNSIDVDGDASGQIATFQPGGVTPTTNAFFQNLGTNGRTCFTCHQPRDDWTVSAASAGARFQASAGNDPLFRLVDGATCPTADISTPLAKGEAYKLLIEKGLIRIGLPLPPASKLQFEVTHVDDPYGCTTNPATGLVSNTTGIVSVYRRPLPATNLGFLTTIMADGREPSLASQAVDATLIHAQAQCAPSAAQQADIVAFETGIFTAQIFDSNAGDLHAAKATGGPVSLSQQLAKFFAGVNDPFADPSFTPNIFDLYKPWLSAEAEYRKSVARGEEVFNTTPINITD